MLRTDTGSIKFLEKGNDFSRYEAILAKPGVLDYNGVKENLVEDELFHPQTIKSFEGLPFSLEHPADGMDSRNWKEKTIGSVYNPRQENGLLKANIIVYDGEIARRIDSGEIGEVSIARTVELVDSDGELIQTKIRGNHVALTKKGRAGKDVRIVKRIDSKGAIMITYRADDGKDYEVPEAVGKDLETQKEKLKEYQESIKSIKKEKEDLENKLKSYKEKKDTNEAIEKLQKELEEKQNLLSVKENEVKTYKQKLDETQKTEPEKIEKAAKERSTLEGQAKAVLGDSVSVNGMTNAQIKDQIIAKVLPYPEGIRSDSITDVVREAQYQAAIQLSNKVANLQVAIKSDSDKTIQDLKQARLNLYKGGK